MWNLGRGMTCMLGPEVRVCSLGWLDHRSPLFSVYFIGVRPYSLPFEKQLSCLGLICRTG